MYVLQFFYIMAYKSLIIEHIAILKGETVVKPQNKNFDFNNAKRNFSNL